MSIGIKRETDSDMETSSTGDNVDEELVVKLEELQKDLALDDDTIKESWEKYHEISSHVTLEGNKLYWLACSLFVTCRMTNIQTLEKNAVKGNPISMTTLLRMCDMSLNQFFHCMKQWIIMAKLPSEVSRYVETVEKNFIVCQNVYKKYLALFDKLFKAPDNEAIRQRKKTNQCTSVRVFEFTWLLFLLMKGKYLKCSDDLVECLKILQACCNIAFKNVFMLDQRELLNADYEGLPPNWNLPGYQLPKEAPGTLDKMLSNFGTLKVADVTYVQEYKISEHLRKLVKAKALKSSKDDFSDLFHPDYFEDNYVALNKIYDQFILEEGSYDEKIFLAGSYRQFVLQSMKCSNGEAITDTPVNERRLKYPETPLTGRQYIGPPDQSGQENPNEDRNRIFSLLSGRSAGLTDRMEELITESSGETLCKKIVNIETELTQKLLQGFNNDEERKTLVVKLFYYLMERILENEKKINNDITLLLEKQVFSTCVYTCAVEIIIFILNMPQHKFPWVLECLGLPSAYFVKIIELVVRCTDQFTRNIIKHLCLVEETILERLMWQSDSVLWEDLKKYNYEIPKFEDIARPGTTLNIAGTPMSRRVLFSAGSNIGSPGSMPSTSETFQSPRYSNIRPGQSLLNPNRNQSTVQNSSNGNANRKNTSFAIIFRKFYILAGVRIDDLCKRLNINDPEFHMKIWTVFEYSVRETLLLQNRHLDQLIMCAVYIICRVCSKKLSHNDKNFAVIMNSYRQQPQAKSEIYRSVYIDAQKRDTLINFYNNIYVVKFRSRFISQFSNSIASIEGLSLSPQLTNKLASPRSQVTKNVYVMSMDSPTNLDFTNSHCYYFNRSDSRDLKTINRAIGKTAKRLLTDCEDRDKKRFCHQKLQALIEEREVQNKM